MVKMTAEDWQDLVRIRNVSLGRSHTGVRFHCPQGLLFGEDSDKDWWFAAEVRRYANWDPWAESEYDNQGSHSVIDVTPWSVQKVTPKGVVLTPAGLFENAIKRFLNLSWLKQWASPTPKEALVELGKRKNIHVEGCRARLARAEDELAAVNYTLFHLEKLQEMKS